jgi:hypothetical protein
MAAPDPECPGCRELREIVDDLRRLIEDQQKRIANLEARVKRTSRNSSVFGSSGTEARAETEAVGEEGGRAARPRGSSSSVARRERGGSPLPPLSREVQSLGLRKDVEVVAGARGIPRVVLHGAAAKRAAHLGGETVLVSITHTRELAMAQALLE